VSRDEIRKRLQGAIDYLNANPAEARYTDSPATARVVDMEGLKVAVEGPDGARLATDMPVSVGGTNTLPSPGWYLRAAEASCVATLIAMRAAHQGLMLDSIEVTVDSESDDRGITGADDSVPAGPLSTRVAVRMRSSLADSAALEAIANWAVDHCPVTDAVKRAIPVRIEVNAAS
jgi:uncharacterized OsmC-like protein